MIVSPGHDGTEKVKIRTRRIESRDRRGVFEIRLINQGLTAIKTSIDFASQSLSELMDVESWLVIAE
jgi:hypothetical protein